MLTTPVLDSKLLLHSLGNLLLENAERPKIWKGWKALLREWRMHFREVLLDELVQKWHHN